MKSRQRPKEAYIYLPCGNETMQTPLFLGLGDMNVSLYCISGGSGLRHEQGSIQTDFDGRVSQ